MTDKEFQDHMANVRAKLAALPASQRARLAPLVEETERRQRLLQDNAERVRSALDDWRVQLKYLLFDNEATRRENKDLRRRLGHDDPT